MALQTIERSSFTKEELQLVQGTIDKQWGFIHVSGPNRNGVYRYDSVLAFNTTNHSQSFGISKRNNAFDTLKTIFEDRKSVELELYYNPEGEKVEQNVTFHIFELTINNELIFSIEDTSKNEQAGTLVFITLALLTLGFYLYILKHLKNTNANKR